MFGVVAEIDLSKRATEKEAPILSAGWLQTASTPLAELDRLLASPQKQPKTPDNLCLSSKDTQANQPSGAASYARLDIGWVRHATRKTHRLQQSNLRRLFRRQRSRDRFLQA